MQVSHCVFGVHGGGGHGGGRGAGFGQGAVSGIPTRVMGGVSAHLEDTWSINGTWGRLPCIAQGWPWSGNSCCLGKGVVTVAV